MLVHKKYIRSQLFLYIWLLNAEIEGEKIDKIIDQTNSIIHSFQV